MIVAIDGPAGAGKSTVAHGVARSMGYQLVNTGALYRAVAMRALRDGVSLEDAERTSEIAHDLRVGFGFADGRATVTLDGDDVTDALREPDVGVGASIVSAHAEVRAALLDVQRALGETHDVVMEGRDIGTVIFPAAEVKVFLTASVRERALRRHAEEATRGVETSLETVEQAIRERDSRDEQRACAPLMAADDAVHVDGTAHSPEELIAHVLTLVRAVRE
ncbi:MAG: cytidylate kinase [Bradymonadia bacterium]